MIQERSSEESSASHLSPSHPALPTAGSSDARDSMSSDVRENDDTYSYNGEGEGDDDREMVMIPDDAQLAEFKSQVKMYIEMDNAIKKLQVMMKDRRAYKQQLADKMVKFMARFNIEDLDTQEGCISSRVTYRKAPLSQKHIRDSIASYFARQNIPDIGLQLTDAVFNDRQRIEQVRLRRRKS